MATREQSLHELERAVAGLSQGLHLVRDAADGLASRAPVRGRLTGFALQVGATVHPGDHLGRIDEDGRFKLAARSTSSAARACAPAWPRAWTAARPRDAGAHRPADQQRPRRRRARSSTARRRRACRRARRSTCASILGASAPALLLADGPFFGDSGGAWVYVLAADGASAQRRAVRLGRRAAGRIEVLDGLRPGEHVVVSAVRRFGDATRLRITSRFDDIMPGKRMTSMIKLRQLSKLHRTGEIETTALDRIDLDIEAGEYLAIIGPVGLRQVDAAGHPGPAGRAHARRVLVRRRQRGRLERGALTRLRRGRIGFVFQSFNLIDDLSVAENVELALRYGGVPAREHRQRVDEALARLGIAHRARHRPSQLSGGQQQRVAIARAIVSGPRCCSPTSPPATSTARTATR